MPAWSGLWNGVYSIPYAALSTNNTREFNNSTKTQLAKLISRDRGTRQMMKIMRALNGVAPGASATATHPQVQPDVGLSGPMVNGGDRTITVENDVSRVTTAADVTTINAVLDLAFYPSSYPVDLSGNGGGDKRNKI